MAQYPFAIKQVIDHFSRLPGIGPKGAERIAFSLLKQPQEFLALFGESLKQLKENTYFCKICFSLSEGEICSICEDETRDQNIICVVENFRDVIRIEEIENYNGLFHVLGGHISPIEGIGPEQLKIYELLKRINSGTFNEVILATNPNIEGDATSAYIKDMLVNRNIQITNIARGIPFGGDIEYADIQTLAKSFQARS